MKILSSTTHLTFLSSNPNILKALAKTAPTKMKWVKRRQEKQNERGGEKAKRRSQDCSVTFNYPNTVLKFCFLYMPGLCMLIFFICIRELQSVWPVNSFVAVLAFDLARQWPENGLLASKQDFQENSQKQIGRPVIKNFKVWANDQVDRESNNYGFCLVLVFFYFSTKAGGDYVHNSWGKFPAPSP